MLCDTMGATPDTIDVNVTNEMTDWTLSDKLRQALWARDLPLYNLGVIFNSALCHKEYNMTNKVLLEIKAYKPNKRLLSCIVKHKGA